MYYLDPDFKWLLAQEPSLQTLLRITKKKKKKQAPTADNAMQLCDVGEEKTLFFLPF